MTNIHVFPVVTSDKSHLDRLSAELSSAIQGNVDLGSRRAHIQHIAGRLTQLSQHLAQMIDDPTFPEQVLNIPDDQIMGNLRAMIAKTAAAGELARRFCEEKEEGLSYEPTRVR